MTSSFGAVKSETDIFVESLPQNLQPKIKDLQKLQSVYDKFYAEYLKELFTLKEKQREKYDPLYKERYAIVSGSKDGEGIPGFWLNVLNKSEEIRNEISEKDAEILNHLIDISSQDFGSPGSPDEGEDIDRGYELVFTFKKNDFFDHEKLTKTYYFDDIDYTILKKTLATKIEWKQGKNPKASVKVHKKTNQTRTKMEPSFFDFFDPPSIPDNVRPGAEQQDEEVFESVERDLELGDIIRSLIPNAVKWYTGELQDEDEEDEEDEYEDDENQEDDEVEDEDEEDEEEENGDADKKKEECKQQ